MKVTGKVRLEQWALHRPFIIARGTMTHIDVLVVELSDGEHVGRGECCPVEHFGETTTSVMAAVHEALARLAGGERWPDLHQALAPGAARNAVDCAWWDLQARTTGRCAWELLDLPAPEPVETVFTISLDTPAAMAEQARTAGDHDILKLKLGADGDAERAAAVRGAVGGKRLIVDVNEGWDAPALERNLAAMAELGVEMVEQPLPAGQDELLGRIQRPVPVGADESCHTSDDLAALHDRYDLVNIKLDKTGGMTEAARLLGRAREQGLEAMVGCMLGTSLAMAPAMLLAPLCRFVDLDAPLLIGRDRPGALVYTGGRVVPPRPFPWGESC